MDHFESLTPEEAHVGGTLLAPWSAYEFADELRDLFGMLPRPTRQ